MVELVCVKKEIRNNEGKVIGYALKMPEEAGKELKERLARGERIVKVMYEPFDAYLEHLRKHGIRHKVFKIDDARYVAVEITNNYKCFGWIAGLAEMHYRIDDGEDLDTVIKHLKKEIEERQKEL